jgi:telomere length regulation protein
VQVVIDQLLLTKGSDPKHFQKLCFTQSQISKKVLYMLLKYLSKRLLNHIDLDNSKPNQAVSAVAGIIQAVVSSDENSTTHLVNWCTNASGAGIGDGIDIRRAVVAALSKDAATLSTVLEKSLAQFGDELYIKHAATLQQEGRCRNTIMSVTLVNKPS